ncbi:MAG: hypothetical protein ACTSYM_14020 [Candidatus Baldrarchaeia archaeon]
MISLAMLKRKPIRGFEARIAKFVKATLTVKSFIGKPIVTIVAVGVNNGGRSKFKYGRSG